MRTHIILSVLSLFPYARALAHGGVDDGDGPENLPPSTDEKTKVAIALGAVVLAAILILAYFKWRNRSPKGAESESRPS